MTFFLLVTLTKPYAPLYLSGDPLLGLTRDLHPLDNAHAERTNERKVKLVSSTFLRDSAGIQTRNLLIRSQVLYSVELRSQTINPCAYDTKVTPLGFKPGTS